MSPASAVPPALSTKPEFLVGVTTLPDRTGAETLARRLVEERVVACAQVEGPIRSFYRWEGAVQSEEEFRLTVKFPVEDAPRVEARIRAGHPYTTPQWYAFRPETALPEYTRWVRNPT